MDRPNNAPLLTDSNRCSSQKTALPDSRFARFPPMTWTSPGLNHNILGGVGLQYLVPSFHDLVMIGDNLLDPGCKQYLQSCAIFNRMRPHVLLNPRIRFPLLRVTLISACVEVGIRKQGRHLSNKSRKKPVGTFARWIHGRTLRRIFTAGQVRIADKP